MRPTSLHPVVLALCAYPVIAAFAQTPVVAKGSCLPASETREEIKSHHLVEPFVALKNAAATMKAEALSAKLCRHGEEFFYEIALLHRDGRLVHAAVSAATGKLVGPHASRETPPRN